MQGEQAGVTEAHYIAYIENRSIPKVFLLMAFPLAQRRSKPGVLRRPVIVIAPFPPSVRRGMTRIASHHLG